MPSYRRYHGGRGLPGGRLPKTSLRPFGSSASGRFSQGVPLAISSRLLPQYHWSIAAVTDSRRFGTEWWRKRTWIRTTIIEWQHLLWWELPLRRFASRHPRRAGHPAAAGDPRHRHLRPSLLASIGWAFSRPRNESNGEATVVRRANRIGLSARTIGATSVIIDSTKFCVGSAGEGASWQIISF